MRFGPKTQVYQAVSAVSEGQSRYDEQQTPANNHVQVFLQRIVHSIEKRQISSTSSRCLSELFS